MLQQIRESDFASIELIVLNDAEKPRRSLVRKILRHIPNLVFVVYAAVEEKLFRTKPDPFAKVDLSDWFEGIPSMRANPRQTKYSDYLEAHDVAEIEKYNLDVLLRLGFRILRGTVLTSTPLGVWSLHHGDVDTYRGGPPAFWELFHDEPVTGSMLQILNEDLDNGLVLCRSYTSTDNLSVRRSRHACFWNSAGFVPRMLQRAGRLGTERFLSEAREQNAPLRFYDRPMYVRPRNLEMIGLWLRHAWRFTWRRLYHALFVNQWILLFGSANGIATSPWRFRHLTPPRDRFWADPHILEKDGRCHVFFEEYVRSRRKAHISVVSFDEDLKPQLPPRVALEQPYHLAYPFVFEYEGDIYMVPDSRANRSVELYRCVAFPDKWELHKTLLEDVDAVDATLLQHAGKWWMFVSISEQPIGRNWDELFLFYADSPLANVWTPHPKNPIVSDARRARPAGGLLQYRNRLYRPSQDCSGRGTSGRYGYALRVNEILTLTEDDYEEIEVSRIEPRWDRSVKAVHTLSQAGRLTVIDAKLRRRRFF